MALADVSPIAAWENYYVIIGSAAAALTGLMFIVITLIAGSSARRSGDGIATFGTPTLFHFCLALFITAVLAAPWPALWMAGVPLGLVGLGEIVYLCVIVNRLRHPTTGYRPVREDWAFHAILPLAAYIILVLAAILLQRFTTLALFGMGAVTLALLFIGIHNAWDTVTFIVFEFSQSDDKNKS